jgi:phosphate-selective porin OprO/OprP
VFGTPILAGDRVLHLGAAFTDRNLDAAQEEAGFRLRIAESGERIATPSLLTREDRQAGLEALYIEGPFSLQGEYFWRDLQGAGDTRDAEVHSHYLQAAWTVTGESRGYQRNAGVPGMIKPAGPGGAVELVAKLERITFDRPEGANPSARAYLAGANWYPNQNVKLMLNVTLVDTSAMVDPDLDDDGLAVLARVQFAF